MTDAGAPSPSNLGGLAEQLHGLGVVPVVEIQDAGSAVALAQALQSGGLPVLEVTFRTDAAYHAMREIAAGAPGSLLIAGTVTSTRQVEQAIEAGARLLVSPGLNPLVVEHAQRLGAPMMPGVCTPSEVESALALGLTHVKLFPIEPIGGIRYLRALVAPYPAMRWNPTGGIGLERLAAYLDIEAVLACGGSWVAPRAEIAAGHFDEIATRAAAAVQVVRGVRPAPAGAPR